MLAATRADGNFTSAIVRAIACLIVHAVTSETFSPNAIGVGVIDVLPAFAPTPMALGLNRSVSVMAA